MLARSKEDGPHTAAATCAEAASAAATSSATEAEPLTASLGAGGAAPAPSAGSGAQPLSLGGAPGEKKRHPWRPPRLGDSFQAVVPAFGQGAEVSESVAEGSRSGWV